MSAEVVINTNLSPNELEKLKKYLIESDIKNIKFAENVSLETVKEVVGLLETISNEKEGFIVPEKEIKKKLSEKELEDLIEWAMNKDSFLVNTLLLEKSSILTDVEKYYAEKAEILRMVKELELTELEAAAFIYGYVKDNYQINNEKENDFYSSVAQKEITDQNANILLNDLLAGMRLNPSLETYNDKACVSLSIDGNTYFFNVVEDMNIKLVSEETAALNRNFAIGLDDDVRQKIFTVVNKRIKYLESSEDEEKADKLTVEVPLPNIEESIKVIGKENLIVSGNTFSIDINEVRRGLTDINNSEKDKIKPGIIKCSTFLEREGITSEERFGDFLIKYGANNELVRKVINVNTTSFYSDLMSKILTDLKFGYKNGETELYIPTTEEDHKAIKVIVNPAGTITIIRNSYSEYYESVIRYGSVSIQDFSLDENKNVILDEKVNEVERIKPEDLPKSVIPPVAWVTASREVITISPVGNIPLKEEVSLLAALDNGIFIAAYETEKDKMEQARRLGFDEMYYRKYRIAGNNIEVNGSTEYLSKEPFERDNEGGLLENADMVLTKRAGQINIWLISIIVGFIIGLGIGIAFLMLHFS